jgi:hypothetical protein
VYAFILQKIDKRAFGKKKNNATEMFMLKNKSSALNNFGIHHYSNGNYEKAIGCCLRSLSLKKKINDQKGIAYILSN